MQSTISFSPFNCQSVSKKEAGLQRGLLVLYSQPHYRPLWQDLFRINGSFQQSQKISDAPVIFKGMSQPGLMMDSIGIAPTEFLDLDNLFLDEFLYDGLHGALRDAHLIGHVPKPDLGITVQTEQHVRMIRQECPATAMTVVL
jgi:hypothetical protein